MDSGYLVAGDINSLNLLVAFGIYAQRGEDIAKTRGWRPCIK